MSNSKTTQKKREVITETSPATGTITVEIWRKDGKRDRPDGPAYIERNAETGITTREQWWKNGNLHRADDRPAIIERDAVTRHVTREEWWKDGQWHRAHGAVVIWYDPETGLTTGEACATIAQQDSAGGMR
jgi:hypothetical protein